MSDIEKRLREMKIGVEPVNSQVVEAANRIAELEAALRPFAAAAFNDNGDVTISTGHITTQDWLRAKRTLNPF